MVKTGEYNTLKVLRQILDGLDDGAEGSFYCLKKDLYPPNPECRR
jgi:hypothetical protein